MGVVGWSRIGKEWSGKEGGGTRDAQGQTVLCVSEGTPYTGRQPVGTGI